MLPKETVKIYSDHITFTPFAVFLAIHLIKSISSVKPDTLPALFFFFKRQQLVLLFLCQSFLMNPLSLLHFLTNGV